MLDLKNPDHEAALRSALGLATHPAMADDPTYCATMAAMANPPAKWAFQALSSPALAADLIRQLVERAGVSRCAFPYPGSTWMTCCRVKGHAPPHAHCVGEDGFECLSEECMTTDMFDERMPPDAALIARLVDLPPNAGAEAVLKALRGDNATINAARAAEVK